MERSIEGIDVTALHTREDVKQWKRFEEEANPFVFFETAEAVSELLECFTVTAEALLERVRALDLNPTEATLEAEYGLLVGGEQEELLSVLCL